ncbi:MAG: hypothetical protein ABL958_20845, partial [Bdellovibrionia bacterium]
MSDKKKKAKKDKEDTWDELADEANESSEESFDYGAESSSLGGAVGEGIKKLFAAGLSAAFLTEESVRSYLQDVKLPKEVLNLFLQGAAKSKEQLMDRVGNEVITIIQKIDFVKEASRFVETHKFRVSAEIEVLKKDKSEEGTSASFSVSMSK